MNILRRYSEETWNYKWEDHCNSPLATIATNKHDRHPEPYMIIGKENKDLEGNNNDLRIYLVNSNFSRYTIMKSDLYRYENCLSKKIYTKFLFLYQRMLKNLDQVIHWRFLSINIFHSDIVRPIITKMEKEDVNTVISEVFDLF